MIAIVGASTGSAPSARSRSESALAWWRVRGTSTRLPESGRVSNQASSSRSAATSPITVTAGGATPTAFSAMFASVPVTTSCRGVVPQRTSATGVDAGLPCATRAPAIAPRRPTPMSSTSVPGNRASASRSTCASGLSGSSCPVTTANAGARPRCVTGIPA